jgi:trk system potassium uptake protein TrkH
LFSTLDYLRGNKRTILWHRTISPENHIRATSVAVIYIGTIFLSVIILSVLEPFTFREIFFEVTSALGTVGLSMGITSKLSFEGKLLLIVLMFWGRIGVITLLYGIMSRKSAPSSIKYPEINIPLG